jgi:hypothetical protein
VSENPLYQISKAYSVKQASYICNYANTVVPFQVWHLGVEIIILFLKNPFQQ